MVQGTSGFQSLLCSVLCMPCVVPACRLSPPSPLQVMLVLSASWPFFPNFLALCDAAATAVEASQAQQQQQQLPVQQPQQADMLPISQMPPQMLPSQHQQPRPQRVQQQPQQLLQQPQQQLLSLPRTAQGPSQGS